MKIIHTVDSTACAIKASARNVIASGRISILNTFYGSCRDEIRLKCMVMVH